VKVLRVEKMATSRAYADYIKECTILHKARRGAARPRGRRAAAAKPLVPPLCRARARRP
jgi:hypothetical protein